MLFEEACLADLPKEPPTLTMKAADMLAKVRLCEGPVVVDTLMVMGTRNMNDGRFITGDLANMM